MNVLASAGEPASRTWQDQAGLGHLHQAAGFGPLLSVSSVYSTAPVHPVARIQLLPRPQGLILNRVGRRREEAIKCKTCPDTGYTDATPVPVHFGNVTQAGELLRTSTHEICILPTQGLQGQGKSQGHGGMNLQNPQMKKVCPTSSRPARSDPALSATGCATKQTPTPALPQLQIGCTKCIATL